jgi:radical SAM protein with 4Fe4S-binding SPASM domain
MQRGSCEALHIDPADYQEELESAVDALDLAGMNVSVYNVCKLSPALWKYARKSISDWKNIYPEECRSCAFIDQCGGFFETTVHNCELLTKKESQA